MVSKGVFTMFRTVLIALLAAAATAAVTTAAAQTASPVRKIAPAPAVGQWQVLRVGAERISHCVMGLRSDAAAPQPGKPQLMFTADDQFVILRVRAAEWSFTAAREIDVTLVTANGREQTRDERFWRRMVFDARPRSLVHPTGATRAPLSLTRLERL